MTAAADNAAQAAARVDRFAVDVPQAVLDDLRDRLARTRWADEVDNDDWRYGANGAVLRELADYWLHGYDWRAREAEMNRLAQFRTTIDQVPVHFVHERGKGPAPIPLLLNHGWPWTFWDFRKVIGPLTDPAAYGGDPADAFDVIAPSLPGYGFSTPLRTPGHNFWTTADLWAQLMTRLGYDRFATQGGDWGAFVSSQLGHKYADRLIGLHIHLLAPLDTFSGGKPASADYAPEEQPWLKRNRAFAAQEMGYFELQRTKPQTLAWGLEDSPVGLLAWLVEKRRTWSDCAGDVFRRFSRDDLLDTATLYWATRSFGSAARYYYEAAHNPWTPSHDRSPRVEAPTAVAVFPREVLLLPRAWAERTYDLRRWTPMPAGGHFAPMEEPEALVADIRAFFRTLRNSHAPTRRG
jgi:pimeloyl-ACP methyl ester carboxylesterase